MRKKPHVIVIGGESREALNVKADVSECVQQLVEDDQFPRIPIEIADNHISKIYSNSIRGRVPTLFNTVLFIWRNIDIFPNRLKSNMSNFQSIFFDL
jgi:hypothetical protein